MNILLLDQFNEFGGAQRCLLELVPAMRERGWNLHAGLPGPRKSPMVRAFEAQGIPVDLLRLGRYTSGRKTPADILRFTGELPRLAGQIRGLARTCRANLIYVNGPRLLPAAALAADGRPMLFHCHSHLTQRSASWVAGCALHTSAATVVACCRYAAGPLADYIEPQRLHVIYNGVPGPQDPPRPSADGLRRIGVIGRIAPEKGQAEFLRAVRLLAPALPGYEFILCGEALFGDPEAERYRQSLGDLAAGLPVEFLGWRDDVYSVLAQLDLLVVPSIREPATTRVILEAYASGVPVVAFATGGIPEVVIDEQTGFLVTPPTPDALAQKVRELLESPARLRDAAEAGRALWRERFTLERYRREVIEQIESCFARASG